MSKTKTLLNLQLNIYFSLKLEVNRTKIRHNNIKIQDKSTDKPELIQEIERFEPKALIEIAADNLENNINVLKKEFKNKISLKQIWHFLKNERAKFLNTTIIPVVFL